MSDTLAATAQAPFWRTHCGSFILNGYMGLHNDYVTKAYLSCGNDAVYPPVYPDIIEFSDDMFLALIRTMTLHSAVVPWPKEWNLEAVIEAVVRRLTEGSAFAPAKLYGAVVRINHVIADGTINFYCGDRLVGETTGWTA